MDPLVVGALYTVRWNGRVWRKARYVGRETVRRRGLTVTGPAFATLDAGTLVLSTWQGVEVDRHYTAPAVIDAALESVICGR